MKNRFISLLLTICSISVCAQESEPLQLAAVDSWQLSVSAGYGKMRSALIDEDDITLVVLPDIRYFGERFYLFNTSVGWTFKETPKYSLSLEGQLNQDGLMFPHKYRGILAAASPPLDINPLPDPDTKVSGSSTQEPKFEIEKTALEKNLTYNAAAVWRYYGWLDASVSWGKDISAGHDGDEISAHIKKSSNMGDWTVEGLLGVDYKSSKLLNYYYGVSDDQGRNIYRPSGGFNWRGQLQLAYPWGENKWLVGALRYEQLSDEIVSSPLIVKDHTVSYFIGVKWRIDD
ncbi:MipA/OmpV family protein [Pseudoalteromonas sp. GB56]